MDTSCCCDEPAPSWAAGASGATATAGSTCRSADAAGASGSRGTGGSTPAATSASIGARGAGRWASFGLAWRTPSMAGNVAKLGDRRRGQPLSRAANQGEAAGMEGMGQGAGQAPPCIFLHAFATSIMRLVGRLAAASLLTTLLACPALCLLPAVDQQDVAWAVGLRR